MATIRPILSLVSIIILAGGVLLDLLVILSGVSTHTPLSKVYFLQADTGGISGAQKITRWTYFAICSATSSGGGNAHCGNIGAAIPFDPIVNFHTKSGNIPEAFIKNAKTYYYLSRVAWAFFLIAVFFAAVALLMSVLALCSRLAAKFTGLITIMALGSQAVAAALMTAWTVKARAAFKSNNQTAKLGTFAYAFTWAAFACFLISTVLFCVGGSLGKDESSYGKSRKSGGYFGRQSSTRSRGSFRDSESGRRVKDEYD